MGIEFKRPNTITQKKVRAKVKDIRNTAIFGFDDIQCFNEVLEIRFEDRHGDKYTKMYQAEHPVALEAGETCWLTVDLVEDETGIVWPKVVEIVPERR